MSAVRHLNNIHTIVRFTPCNCFCSVEIQNLVACLIIHAQNCVSVYVTVVFLLPSRHTGYIHAALVATSINNRTWHHGQIYAWPQHASCASAGIVGSP